ncbi:type 1 fimbrial protein [Zestomonas carbonaria]|uniref:Type 1 fimbrial protein n=1 Tax=Zestomonas carbonaria TaxID=2762745 RepID=A0A7U7IBJ4_9GAMM|nr:type 1 fimbrial protein [Pseudomonas carbonaria]CAD5108957.1 hypothetical protein PSEWESI4_03253 [Pseudomonas carbonaria]
MRWNSCVCCLVLSFAASTPALGSGGTITFRGAVVEPPCSAETQTVGNPLDSTVARIRIGDCATPLQVSLADSHSREAPTQINLTDLHGNPLGAQTYLSPSPEGQFLQLRRQAQGQKQGALVMTLTYL